MTPARTITLADEIRRLTSVADGRAWFRANGHTLNTAEHLAFINRMQSLIKMDAGQ